jgi:hypothetical protein
LGNARATVARAPRPVLVLCVPECGGTLGRNGPLRPLKSAEVTEEILKISGFSGLQRVGGSMGEFSIKFTMPRQLGAKQTVFGGKHACRRSYLEDEV